MSVQQSTITVLPLLATLREHALNPDLHSLLDPEATERQWLEIPTTDDLQLWLISWPLGAATGWHDHGPASGAFTVLRGRLVERSWNAGVRLEWLWPGDSRAFVGGHVHDVSNDGNEPALSLHAYSPRLTTMTRYALIDGLLETTGIERAGAQW